MNQVEWAQQQNKSYEEEKKEGEGEEEETGEAWREDILYANEGISNANQAKTLWGDLKFDT